MAGERTPLRVRIGCFSDSNCSVCFSVPFAPLKTVSGFFHQKPFHQKGPVKKRFERSANGFSIEQTVNNPFKHGNKQLKGTEKVRNL